MYPSVFVASFFFFLYSNLLWSRNFKILTSLIFSETIKMNLDTVNIWPYHLQLHLEHVHLEYGAAY